MRTAVSCLLAVTLFALHGVCQENEYQGTVHGRQAFVTSRCFSKGGIGIVDKKLYIVVKSGSNDLNELILAPTEGKEERWKGASVKQSQVVFVYEDKVWAPDRLPDQFDLSKAVVISFEVDKIRFFDFRQAAGCCYDRIRE